MVDPTKESNMSFSFNLELDEVDSNTTSDSDTTGLQIDVSEVENFSGTDRLRREAVEDTSFINEMEEKIERQLDAKAAKTNNLTATNVKNILKDVISNDHVMAVVHKRLNKEPKLTRAKVKELSIAQPDIPWSLIPEKNTTLEVQIRVQEDFPEDLSDEDYHPDKVQQSDDEKDMDNSVGSDTDSQPSTPATPNDMSIMVEMQPSTPSIQYNEEGIFKIPQMTPHVPTEEESIGHRTRSKLCLSETPLEQIEQAFIPPDITTDMYDWEPEDEYINFLKELYTQPLQKEANMEDDPESDPEADPEYNILEDVETLLLDIEEELREDKEVKVSKKELKKELKTLIAELDEFADQYTKQQEEEQQQQQKESKKKRTPVVSFSSLGNTSGNPMVDLLPVLVEPELPELVNSRERYLLSVQISQHVQLTAQQFVMTYKHPKLHHLSKICKDNLYSLSTLADRANSEFMPKNLLDALKLVSDWEQKLDDPKFLEKYMSHLEAETELEKQFIIAKKKYKLKFHPELLKLMAESKALMHSHLLPDVFPTSIFISKKVPYLHSEEKLIALGLEQFIPYVQSLQKKFNRTCDVLADAVKEVQRYLLPIRDVNGLMYHIRKQRRSKKHNPIKQYFDTGSAPRVEHVVLNKYKLIAPKNQPTELLSPLWQDFVNHLQRGDIEDFLILPKPQNKKVSDYDEDSFLVPNDEIIAYKDHQLRNPIVNILKPIPSLLTTQKDDSSNTSPKSSTKNKMLPSKANETESDAEYVESQRSCETDEEESGSTQLKMTTPRLAKIKSVDNMKLMAQTLFPKVPTCNSNTSESKDHSFDKNDDDDSSFIKGDNEDEIAELMLASTTIKKTTNSRKTLKQARELENLKRLLEAESNVNEDERATKFAASFIQKIHSKLESKDSELFKTVLKIFLDYSEKLENPDQISNEDDFLNESSYSNPTDSQTAKRHTLDKDKLSVNLYKEVCEKLHEYPDLCSDFLLFLTPHQAALIDKSVQHTMMLRIKEFINVTQKYFAKQPSRIEKVMQAMTKMVSDPCITVKNAQTFMGAALKGHPLLMDMFLQVLPPGKPPDSLFSNHMFEKLSCTVGPHDRNKEYAAHAYKLYDNMDLPVAMPREDPYEGDSYKCDCHSLTDNSKLKGINEYCVSCGTRFLNGKIYLQTSEGLRPAKITFPGSDDEKLENISRVSLKTAERFIPCPPPSKRRKGDCTSEDPNMKPCSLKTSPIKDNKGNDRSTSKFTRGTKLRSKLTDHKKLSSVRSAALKTKREKKTEKKENKSEQRTDDDKNLFCISGEQTEFAENIGNNVNKELESNYFNNKFGEISTDSHKDDTLTSPEKMNVSYTSIDKLDATCVSDSSTNVGSESPLKDVLAWTMQEDKILLENVQKEYSEKTFHTISLLLKNRTIDEVKERCEYLLSLIEKMV